jgi:ADP-ribosylglycohydrolase
MIGAICGDIIGAPYERYHIKTTEFPLFSPFSKYTDDTVLTVATMDALLHRSDFACTYRKWYAAYPYAGYGGVFRKWCNNESSKPYNSCGNGSAMRVSPVAIVV